MKSLRTLLFLALSIGAQAWAGANDLCTRVFTKEGLPSPAGEKLLSKAQKLVKHDERMAWRKLSEKIGELDRLDNFTSPATQQLILGTKLSPATEDALRRLAKEPTRLNDFLSAQGIVLDARLRWIVDSIEKRFRVSAELLNAGANALPSGQAILSAESYWPELLATLKKSLSQMDRELGNGSLGSAWIDSVQPTELRAWVEKQDPASSLLKFRFASQKEIHPTFAKTLQDRLAQKPTPDFSSIEQSLSEFLDHELRDLPVGISYRPADLAANVRFGEKHFFGSVGLYDSTSRRTMLRTAGAHGGMVEASFELSNPAKKEIALGLDRTHQELDRFFALPLACDRGSYTCGTYAPLVFLRHGVPLTPGGYGAPSLTMLSLALQKALKLPYLKEVSVTHMGQGRLLRQLPLVLTHDGVAATTEIGFYTLLVWGGFKVRAELRNEKTGQVQELKVNNKGEVTGLEPAKGG